MTLLHDYLLPAMWVAVLVYWRVLARNTKETERRETTSSRLIRLVAIVSAALLLLLPILPGGWLCGRILPQGELSFWAGAFLTAAGLLFAVWGRHELGQDWSQAVTLKEGHELVTSGPYALVRHPIYTGLLLGFVGCAVARGEWRGLLAVLLVFIVLWRKLKVEEQWMRAQFGDAYGAYARRVSALVPFAI
jgi:protein-S-isoprenylcysteine O-methyltransferase Ste14